MQTLISNSIHFKNVIKDLAEELEVPLLDSCNVFSLNIPKTHGEGTIKGINFDEGIGIMIYDCTFYEDTEFQFILNTVHPLKFLFCEKGILFHRFQDIDKENKIDELQNIIVASNQNKGHILRFKKNIRTKVNNLEIERKRFFRNMSCEINKLKPNLKELFKDVDGKKLFFHKGSYSFKTAGVFSKINLFEGNNFQYNLFIHGKTYKMFHLQILEYKANTSALGKNSILLKRELKSIREAADYIDENIRDFQSVTILAEQIGMNTNKLQNGFKEVYEMTVNEYIQAKRLLIASVLIKNTDDSFSEIADKVGIRSQSYLSKIFKDRYGLTPTEIRRDNKTNRVIRF